MERKQFNFSLWLFRVLVLGACAFMVVVFLKPWWVGRFETGNSIRIYGWGLRHNLEQIANYIANQVTPVWQVALAWVYVGVSITAAIFSTLLKKWWGALMLGITGLGFIAYVFVSMNVVIENGLAKYNLPLDGITEVGQNGAYFLISCNIQPTYHLAYYAGGAFVALAVLRVIIPARMMRGKSTGTIS